MVTNSFVPTKKIVQPMRRLNVHLVTFFYFWVLGGIVLSVLNVFPSHSQGVSIKFRNGSSRYI
jgi:hypothetical protein